MGFPVFIGWDSGFPEPALVAAHTLRKRSSIPLEVRFLDLRHLRDCYGYRRPLDPQASTEFSFTRFLVPYLCGYAGRAIFVDNDVVFFDDIARVISLSMDGLALRCVQQNYKPTATTKMYGAPQEAYPRKLWSSLMLLNCPRLTLWTKQAVETRSGAWLHRFEGIPDDEIGAIPANWNEVHALTAATAMFHWTEFNPWHNPGKCAHEDAWLAERDEYRATLE